MTNTTMPTTVQDAPSGSDESGQATSANVVIAIIAAVIACGVVVSLYKIIQFPSLV